jgi:hypothetical protein
MRLHRVVPAADGGLRSGLCPAGRQLHHVPNPRHRRHVDGIFLKGRHRTVVAREKKEPIHTLEHRWKRLRVGKVRLNPLNVLEGLSRVRIAGQGPRGNPGCRKATEEHRANGAGGACDQNHGRMRARRKLSREEDFSARPPAHMSFLTKRFNVKHLIYDPFIGWGRHLLSPG